MKQLPKIWLCVLASVSLTFFWTSVSKAEIHENHMNPIFSIQSRYEIPTDQESRFHVGTRKRGTLPSKFKVLNWNIEKAKQEGEWANDFSKLVPNYDLVLLQEVEWNSLIKEQFESKKGLGWSYFAMWRREKDQALSGLASGSKVLPIKESFLRTEDREPFLKTPKMISIQNFSVRGLSKGQSLLVINIHAINFVSTKKFKRQLQQVVDVVNQHVGPVLFIGDMNTWNHSRTEAMHEMMSSVGLVHHDFHRPHVPGMHADLDHVFSRGLKIRKVGFLEDVMTSDHFPIAVEAEVVRP